MNEIVSQLIEEVNNIDKTLSQNKIEIGKKFIAIRDELKKKKSWIKYITDNTNYDRKTVNNYIRVVEEFSYGELISRLDHTKLIILLSLPQELREQFIKDNDLEKMSCAEIKKAIKKINDEINPKEKKEKETDESEPIEDDEDLEGMTEKERLAYLKGKRDGFSEAMSSGFANVGNVSNTKVKDNIKQLSKLIHPDITGGDSTAMALLNAIKDELKI